MTFFFEGMSMRIIGILPARQMTNPDLCLQNNVIVTELACSEGCNNRAKMLLHFGNAPCHSTVLVASALADHELPQMDERVQSLDLSPREFFCFFGWLKIQMINCMYTNLEELKDDVTEILSEPSGSIIAGASDPWIS
jgi:hypothetical protein